MLQVRRAKCSLYYYYYYHHYYYHYYRLPSYTYRQLRLRISSAKYFSFPPVWRRPNIQVPTWQQFALIVHTSCRRHWFRKVLVQVTRHVCIFSIPAASNRVLFMIRNTTGYKTIFQSGDGGWGWGENRKTNLLHIVIFPLGFSLW